jgi:hypothetical protein
MEALRARFRPAQRQQSQRTEDVLSSPVEISQAFKPRQVPNHEHTTLDEQATGLGSGASRAVSADSKNSRERDFRQYSGQSRTSALEDVVCVEELVSDSQLSTVSSQALELRAVAQRSMTANLREQEQGQWCTIGLISATDHHTVLEPDLGND